MTFKIIIITVNVVFCFFQVIATEVVDNRNKTASTVVTVSVTNINDNFPIFDKLEYFADISENANIGDFVGKVE